MRDNSLTKRVVKQILYSLILFAYIIFTIRLSAAYKNTFDIGLLTHIYLVFGPPLIIGLILGANWLIQADFKNSQWQINKLQLIFLTLPALFFYLSPVLYYSNLNLFFLQGLMGSLMTQSVTTITGIILGYSLSNSLQKVPRPGIRF